MRPDPFELFSLWRDAHHASCEAEQRFYAAAVRHARGEGPPPPEAWRREAAAKLAHARTLLQMMLRANGVAAASLRPHWRQPARRTVDRPAGNAEALSPETPSRPGSPSPTWPSRHQ